MSLNLAWNPIEYFSNRFSTHIEFIVVHWSGGYTLESAFNTLKQRKLSYHYMVDGETIWQLVDEKNIAYHAGNWTANTKSVGVCHIGIYDSPVKEASYEASGQLLAEICRRNGLVPGEQTIIPHKDIVRLFGSGTVTACPGSLDLARLISTANRYYLGETPEAQPVLESVPPPIEPYPKDVIVKDTVHRRSGPGTQYSILENPSVYKPGETLHVLEEVQGESVNNISKWYNTGYGFFWSGAIKGG